MHKFDRLRDEAEELERLRSRVRELEQQNRSLRRDAEFRMLIEHSPDYVARIDATGRILFINRAVDGSSPEEMRNQIDKAVREVDQGQGVLMLVDMFGGTPSNLCLSFLDEDRIEVVTGLNLPMLVKVVQLKDPIPIQEVAALIREYGRRNIRVASELLAGNDQEERSE